MELVADNDALSLSKGYKQTEVGLIPSDWEVKTLGDIAIVKDGTHQTPTYVDYGIPFYSVESVTNNNFSDTKFITEEAHKILTKSFKIERGDILMTRIGSIGDCKLVDWDVNASFYVSLALLKIKSEYLPSYIAHYSKSASFQKETEINSLQSAIPRKINLGPISKIRVLIPTKTEQKAIATALSDADALINSLEKLIAKKRMIKKGATQKLLEPKDWWKVKTLGEILIKKSKTTHQSSFGLKEGLYPFFTNSSNDKIEKYFDNYDFDDEAIIANTGGVSFFKYYHGKFAAMSDCFVFTSNQITKFVYYFLKSIELMINDNGFTGSGIKHLDKEFFLKIEILLPEIEEQTHIATILSDMDAEINALESKLEKYRKVKLGMMQNLLTGKIRLI